MIRVNIGNTLESDNKGGGTVVVVGPRVVQLAGVDGPVEESNVEEGFLFVGQNGTTGAHVDPTILRIQNHFTFLWMEISRQTNVIVMAG